MIKHGHLTPPNGYASSATRLAAAGTEVRLSSRSKPRAEKQQRCFPHHHQPDYEACRSDDFRRHVESRQVRAGGLLPAEDTTGDTPAERDVR